MPLKVKTNGGYDYTPMGYILAKKNEISFESGHQTLSYTNNSNEVEIVFVYIKAIIESCSISKNNNVIFSFDNEEFGCDDGEPYIAVPIVLKPGDKIDIDVISGYGGSIFVNSLYGSPNVHLMDVKEGIVEGVAGNMYDIHGYVLVYGGIGADNSFCYGDINLYDQNDNRRVKIEIGMYINKGKKRLCFGKTFFVPYGWKWKFDTYDSKFKIYYVEV